MCIRDSSYHFDVVIFFAQPIFAGEEYYGEYKDLENCLRICADRDVNRFIYVRPALQGAVSYTHLSCAGIKKGEKRPADAAARIAPPPACATAIRNKKREGACGRPLQPASGVWLVGARRLLCV